MSVRKKPIRPRIKKIPITKKNPAICPSWLMEVVIPREAPAFSRLARSREMVVRTGMMMCSPALKRTIKMTTITFVIRPLMLVNKSPVTPPAMIAMPILKILLSANLYISARISIKNKPGVSLKNSTMPRSNGVM